MYNQENVKKTQFVKNLLNQKKHERCISEMTIRERNSNEYRNKVNKLREEQEAALKNLKELEDKFQDVAKKTGFTSFG